MTLGSRRVAVEPPRLRSVDGREEVQLASYRHFADRDTLTRVVLERMLAGVWTRRFPRTQEPVGEQVEAEGRSTSKSAVRHQLRRAWADSDHDGALRALQALAAELDRSHPGAAGSLREGMEETLTLTRLGIGGTLKRTLESTNPCESMIECVRRGAPATARVVATGLPPPLPRSSPAVAVAVAVRAAPAAPAVAHRAPMAASR